MLQSHSRSLEAHSETAQNLLCLMGTVRVQGRLERLGVARSFNNRDPKVSETGSMELHHG